MDTDRTDSIDVSGVENSSVFSNDVEDFVGASSGIDEVLVSKPVEIVPLKRRVSEAVNKLKTPF
jgi:hypothetical protein